MALIVTMLSCIPSSAKEPELDSGYSNIRVEDYVGPEVCGSCHSENFTNWQQHPHSRMNQLATVASVLGDFSGVGVEYGGRRAVFLRQGDDFFGHQELATLAGARSHSHHDADQASCLDCHMPRIVQGFTGYNRSHRISSPSEPEILATGMPNTCNLCHLDRSLAWTRDTIASRWGTRVTLSPSLMPEFGANFELAAGAYARSPLGRTALPALTRHLEEPNAYVRLRFLLAVERILGRRLSDEEYTLMGGDERRQTQLRLLRGRLPNL